MSRALKFVTLPLVAVIVLNCLVLQVPLPTAANHQHCHGQRDEGPGSDGTKFRCCLTGHDVAMPQFYVLSQPTMQISSVAVMSLASLPGTAFLNKIPATSVAPGPVPLRI